MSRCSLGFNPKTHTKKKVQVPIYRGFRYAEHKEKPSFFFKTRFLLHDNILTCSGEGRGYLMKQMMVMLILTLLVSSVRAEIFRDNFNDGDLKGWTLVQGAEDGGIENRELVLGSPKAGSEAEVTAMVDGIIASDYEVSVSLKISKLAIGGGATIGLRAHTDPLLEPFIEQLAEGEANKRARMLLYNRSYRFSLGNIDTGGSAHIQDIRKGFAATIQLMKVVRGENVWNTFVKDKLHTFREFDFKLHEWYRLKVIAKGNLFQCFIDDEEMLDFLDDTYTAGKIYLSSGRGSRVHFDNFEVQYEALSVQPRKQLTTTWGEVKSNFH